LSKNKQQIRQILLGQCHTVPAAHRAAAAQTAMQHLIINALFNNSQHIACYFSQADEFDCMPIIQAVWQAEKKCYLPLLSFSHPPRLEFAAYGLNDSLCLNRYKIFEPQGTEKIAPEDLDLVILPLVGFDVQGHRLGRGSGYYDRTFTFKQKPTDKPFLLGLAYQLQKVDTLLPHDAWDIPLNGILTEEAFLSII
jgi:5-formyltetrahydrofolate cyclo-ligase